MVLLVLAALVFLGISVSYVFRGVQYPEWMHAIRSIATGIAFSWSWLVLGRTLLIVNSAVGLVLPIEAVKALNILLGARAASVLPWIVGVMLLNNCVLQLAKGCCTMRLRHILTTMCLAAVNGYMQTSQAEVWKWMSLASVLMGVVASAVKAVRRAKIEKDKENETELSALKKQREKLNKRIAALQGSAESAS